ncbi:MAG: tetraacyldisaccharide 4'-kinase [Deltaproteobacteria bacterium]|nr:tetraacyldisaccharide 4'-kinase [Deltaproteobacteria bacterium]
MTDTPQLVAAAPTTALAPAVPPTLLERAWYGTPPAGFSIVAPLLRATGWLVGRGTAIRNRLFDGGTLRADKLEARVISVGNLVVGGAGKTPVVMELARRILARGRRVAIVSRGYGGQPHAPLVSDGAKIFQGARECGDEPLLMAKRVTEALVLVGADRVRVAREAISKHGAQVILLDDGFQHRRLARDEDVLVLGGAAPLGNGMLLPAGPLRESVAGARRATVAWLANGAEHASLPELPTRRVVSRHRAIDVVDWSLSVSLGSGSVVGKRVFLLAGLARPQGFVETVLGLGAQVVGAALFRDHHAYTAEELDHVVARAQQAGAELVVTTEKDAVRLEKTQRTALPVVAVRMDVEILEGLDVIAGLVDAC